MNTIQELNELQLKTIRNIEALHDFHVFTGFSYDRFSKMVDAGHVTGSVYNVRTHKEVEVQKLSLILLNYLDNDLPNVVIYEIVSQFEYFFFQLLEIILSQNPHALGKEKTLKFEDIRKADDKEMRIKYFINKELSKCQGDWFEYLRKAVDIEIDPAHVSRFSEIKATRNAFAHNCGIADEKYLKISGKLARASLGKRLELSRPYIYGSADFIKDFICELIKLVSDKFKNPN